MRDNMSACCVFIVMTFLDVLDALGIGYLKRKHSSHKGGDSKIDQETADNYITMAEKITSGFSQNVPRNVKNRKIVTSIKSRELRS